MKSNITLFLLLFASNILNASAAPTCAPDDKKKAHESATQSSQVSAQRKDAATQTSHQEPCVSNEKLSQLILALESQNVRLESAIEAQTYRLGNAVLHALNGQNALQTTLNFLHSEHTTAVTKQAAKLAAVEQRLHALHTEHASAAHRSSANIAQLEQRLHARFDKQHRASTAYFHQVSNMLQAQGYAPYEAYPQEYYYAPSAAGLPTIAAQQSQPSACNASAALAPHATAHSQHHSSVVPVAELQTAAAHLLKSPVPGASATNH